MYEGRGKYIILMQDGKPIGLPYGLNNYKQTYPDFDYDALPTETHAKYFCEPVDTNRFLKPWEYICRDDPLIVENGNVYERHTIKEIPELERQLREEFENEEPPFEGWLRDTNYLIWIPPPDVPIPDDNGGFLSDNERERWW